MKNYKKITFGISLLFLTFFNGEILLSQLAFPNAEGFGKYTTGGRGGTVYHVTNLNDNGTGSFRDAVSQSNRIVVFDVGGVINISSRIVISSNITIAGQTAPGGGITIYGDGIALNGDSGNDIIRYIRIRMGKNGTRDKDAVSISEGTNYMFDHVSISWGRDGTLDVNGTGIDNLSFQDCIIAQGINNQNHSTGGLMQSGRWSMIRSLYIDNKTRNPKARGTHEFINSVLYNWGTNGYIMGDTEGLSECNMIGNYFIYGPSSSSGTHFTNSTSSFHIYPNDNWVDSDKDGVLDGSLVTSYGSCTIMSSAYGYPGVNNVMSAQNALSYVINNVGASLVRDEVDELLISRVKSYGTAGSIISTENDNGITNNVGTVESGVAPTDSDQDGMPDSWESANGMNPYSDDHNSDNDGDGYTNIEEYLEWIIDNHDAASSTVDAFSTIEAEDYYDQSGVRTEDCDEGGLNVAYIEDGDWISFADVDFGDGASSFTARAASPSSGIIRILLDGTSGTQIGTCTISTTGAWQTYADFTCDITETSGVHDLYLVFEGGDGYLLNVNYFSFEESGATTVTYTLTTSVSGSGSVTGAGTYDEGTTVTLTATPSSGYEFSSWSGVDSYSGTTAHVTMTSNRSVTAVFTETSNGVYNATINGTYSILASHSGKALDVYAWGTDNGTNICQWEYWEGETQQFNITPVDGIWHRITPVLSTDKALDIYNISTDNGANINIWEYWGGHGQQFRFQAAGSGKYRIINRNSGKCVDVEAASSDNGANVFQWECISGASNQMFQLVRLKSGENATSALTDVADEINVYPNPVASDMYIRLPQKYRENVSISIFDIAGKRILSKDNISGTEYQMDLGGLNSGIYVLFVSNGKENITQKFSKN